MDTAAWADAGGELIQDAETRAAVSSYLVEQAFSGGDAAARVLGVLPPGPAPRAPALPAALEDVARRLAEAGELDRLRRAVRAVRALSQLLTLLVVALGLAAVWTAAPGAGGAC